MLLILLLNQRASVAVGLCFRRKHHRRRHAVARLQIQQPHALRGASRFADGRRIHADDFAVVADQHDFGRFVDLRDADDFADAFRGLHVDDAVAAAVGAGGIRRRRCVCRSRFR